MKLSKLELSQSITGYRYSIDSFILADFVHPSKENKIIDFGTGNGILPLLLARKTTSKIIGVEIQSSLLRYALRNIAQRRLKNQVTLIKGDIKFSKLFLKNSHFDIVVSNPPYRKLKCGRLNPNSEKAIARHEIIITLADIIENAAILLCEYGKLAMIYLPERYDELMSAMIEKRLTPSKIRFVYSNKNSDPKMFLVEAVKKGNGDLTLLSPLYIYDNNGNYTLEMQRIYDFCNNSREGRKETERG